MKAEEQIAENERLVEQRVAESAGLTRFSLWIPRSVLAQAREQAWKDRQTVGQYISSVLIAIQTKQKGRGGGRAR